MGQREIDNFNRNAADFMARFGNADGCQCAQCVKTRREGVIEGLAQAAAIIEAEPFSCPEIIRAEIERLRAEQKEQS